MKLRIFIAAIVILLALAIMTFIGWFIWKPEANLLQGEISAKSYKVSSQMPGRIDSLLVERGQKVEKGQLLFVLHSNTLDAKKEQANALHAAAAAQNQKAEVGARSQQKELAEQAYNNAKVQEAIVKKTYDRIKKLYDEGVVSAQQYDEVEARYDAARNTTLMAKAQYDLVLEGAQREDKMAAAAILSQAAGGVKEVDSYLNDSHQYSPVDGEIASVISEEGELVGAGMPIVTVVDMSDSWAVFNIKETNLSKFQVGKVITTYIPAIDKNVDMKITFISVLASYATWSATSASGDFDVKTFEVHARPVQENLNDLRLGMSVLIDYNSL